jgi:multicomponent Na+:H+ antiporter subunit G
MGSDLVTAFWADAAQFLAAALLVGGALFALAGAVGILRLPDVYARSHAASKAGTVGSVFALVAIAVQTPDLHVATRALAGMVFLLLTAPVSAHLLMRAAHVAGCKMDDSAVIDEMPR